MVIEPEKSSWRCRQKLEDVVTLDDANEVYKMEVLPMTDFEINIWERFGRKFCQKVDRIQVSYGVCKKQQYNLSLVAPL